MTLPPPHSTSREVGVALLTLAALVAISLGIVYLIFLYVGA